MTIAASNAVYEHYHGSRRNKAVLLALADRADKERWECYPSVADTARRTGYCDRSVQDALKALKAEGAIECVRFGGVQGSRGGKPTNRYRIVRRFLEGDGAGIAPWDGAAAAPWDGAGIAPSEAPTCNPEHATVQLTLPDGAGTAPEPRDEPSKDLRARVGAAECPACEGTGRGADGSGGGCEACGGSGVNPALRVRGRGR